MSDVPLALLAGGLATRLGPISQRVPKAMVDLEGRPFIDHQLALFRRHGVRRVVLCLGHLGEQVEDHIGNGAAHGLHVEYSHDGPGLLGTGGALRRALSLLGEQFWVVYGDSYVDIDFAAVLKTFQAADTPALMTVLENSDRWDKSNVVYQHGRLLAYDKTRRTPEMQHVDYGVALLTRSVAERIPPARSYDLAELYGRLVAEGLMQGYEVNNRFYEIGTPDSLEETRSHLRSKYVLHH
jgi:NDP-sugar pyrophosphorylase family protein